MINLDTLEVVLISVGTTVFLTYYIQWKVDRKPKPPKLPKAKVLR
jgi:hypothetical protein